MVGPGLHRVDERRPGASRCSGATTSRSSRPSSGSTTCASPRRASPQADLAREHGIHGFCYWHYWFAGRRMLDRPFDEVLESGEPDFPFCAVLGQRALDAGLGRSDERDPRAPGVLGRRTTAGTSRWLLARVRRRPLREDRREARVPRLPGVAHARSCGAPQTCGGSRRPAGGLDLYLCRVELDAPTSRDPTSLGFDAGVEFQPDFTDLGRPLRRGLGESDRAAGSCTRGAPTGRIACSTTAEVRRPDARAAAARIQAVSRGVAELGQHAATGPRRGSVSRFHRRRSTSDGYRVSSTRSSPSVPRRTSSSSAHGTNGPKATIWSHVCASDAGYLEATRPWWIVGP